MPTFKILLMITIACSSNIQAMLRTKKMPVIPAIPSVDATPQEPAIISPKSLGYELIAACKSGELIGPVGLHVVRDFIAKKADLTVCDYHGSALMWAAARGLNEIIELLLTSGASLETVSKRGYTALHAAAQRGQIATIYYLFNSVHQPTDINKQAACGSTALHLASQEGHCSVVAYLTEMQPGLVDLRDRLGRTPLHLAAWQGHTVICRQLLASGADLEARAKRDITPLYAAVYGNFLATAQFLINAGASTELLTQEGLSLLDCAAQHKDKVLYTYLKKRQERVEAFNELRKTFLQLADEDDQEMVCEKQMET